MMLVQGTGSAFPVDVQDVDGKKAFHIANNMFLIIDPSDGRGFVSTLNGSGHDLPQTCHNR